MRAAVVPSVNGKWEVRDMPQPEAGTDQVLIKIHASGICYTDVHETAGHIPGTLVMGAGGTAMPVSPTHLLSQRIRIIGSMQNGAPFLHEALEIAAQGKVKVIEETYSLQDIGRAYERVEKGQVRFRAVVVN